MGKRIVNWSKRPAHAHYYYADSTIKEDHEHIVDGFTFSVNGSNTDNHMHAFKGVTSFEKGHYHRYYGKTGSAIPLPNGTHYHEISGRVYFNYNVPEEIEHGGVVYSPAKKDVHDHNFKGLSGEPLGYYPSS